MVIPDWTVSRSPKIESQPPLRPQTELAPLARPLDRLAAVIVDVFVLLAPIFILLSAPFKRALTASFILGAESEFVILILSMVTLAVGLIVFYQALMHYFFGATVGKMIFNLRVVPVFNDGKISLLGSLSRSVVWVLEVLCLGLPWLAVFSNARRRILHDRISDSVVVSRTPSAAAEPPRIWERGLVRGFTSFCLILAAIVTLAQFKRILSAVGAGHHLSGIIQRDMESCEAVSQNVDEEANVHDRMQMAMSLYAAGLADKSCLESELERQKALQSPANPLSYLAQAFVNADDAEVSNSYLDQVCEESPESVECSMSSLVSRWSEENWKGVDEALKNAKSGSGYLEVWGVRHYMKQGHYQEALKFLDDLSGRHELAEFSLVQRVKALYNSYLDNEAEAALAQALPVMTTEDATEVSSWMCAQQLQNGCSSLAKISCKDVRVAPKEQHEIDFERTSEALSRVMALECSDQKDFDYLTFSESVHDEDWKLFFRANLKQQRGDKRASFGLYEDVLTSESAPDLLKVEALRRVSQFADRQQLASLYEIWQGLENHEIWTKAGNILFNRLVQKNEAEVALKVARELLSSQSLAPKAISQMDDMLKAPIQVRAPASLQPRQTEESE